MFFFSSSINAHRKYKTAFRGHIERYGYAISILISTFNNKNGCDRNNCKLFHSYRTIWALNIMPVKGVQ